MIDAAGGHPPAYPPPPPSVPHPVLAVSDMQSLALCQHLVWADLRKYRFDNLGQQTRIT